MLRENPTNCPRRRQPRPRTGDDAWTPGRASAHLDERVSPFRRKVASARTPGRWLLFERERQALLCTLLPGSEVETERATHTSKLPAACTAHSTISEAIVRLGVQSRKRAADPLALVVSLILMGGTWESGRIATVIRD